MFQLILDLDTDIQKLNIDKFFERFQKYENVLPSWTIRFHNICDKSYKKIIDKHEQMGGYQFTWDANGYLIYDMINGNYLRIQEDFLSADCYVSDGINQDIYELIRHGYKYRALVDDVIIIHSSTINYQNKGVMFIGNSGAGKSTQAELWKTNRGALVINYDQNAVFLQDNQIIVNGTPWGGKEQYYSTENVPLYAIAYVQKALYNNAVLLGKGDAFSTVLLNNYLFPFNDWIEEKYLNLVSDIISRIPVYMLFCTKGLEAVKVIENALIETDNDRRRRI